MNEFKTTFFLITISVLWVSLFPFLLDVGHWVHITFFWDFSGENDKS